MIERVVGSHLEQTDDPDYDEEITFRNPEKLKKDRFDQWIRYIDFDDELIDDASYHGKAAAGALRIMANELDIEGKSNYAIEKVSNLITTKKFAGDAEYFLELTLEGADNYYDWSYSPHDEIWENYNIEVDLHNCMPANEIKRQLAKFGGGMLMSATLSPLDVYTETVGVDELPHPVERLEFDLRFPESNRGTYIVPLQQYTSGNRGDTSESNETRNQYRETIINIIQSAEGNTLVGMPSYSEAEWIESKINSKLNVPTYLDESSTREETVALKEAFEQQGEGVLVTSLRGTLTEGVDYSGDKLSNAIVVGVPLTYPYSNRAEAIKTAFAVKFGRKNAFDYSHTLPAIYKSRQALGRVIRSTSDVGTMTILDERYTNDHYRSVNEYLSTQEQSEYEVVNQDDIGDIIAAFWMDQ
jgi:DNA excision repair protein ERCC-2